jgi:hypothetical protein
MEEKLQSLIDPKKSTQKTERQSSDDKKHWLLKKKIPGKATDFFEQQL